MGAFCVTRSNPTHQLTDSTQLNPTQPIASRKIWTQPNTTNNGAYSLVVTCFYTQNLSRTFSQRSINLFTDMGNTHKKFPEGRRCSSEDMIADRQTHTRQTDIHAHRNTPLPYRGRRNAGDVSIPTRRQCTQTAGDGSCHIATNARKIYVAFYFSETHSIGPVRAEKSPSCMWS